MWITSATEITSERMHVTVVGGGSGSSAWIAKVTGSDERYGLALDFLDRNDQRSTTGRSGWMEFPLQGEGLYKYGNIAARNNRGDRWEPSYGFIVVLDGEVYKISRKPKTTVKKIVAALDANPEAFGCDPFRAELRTVLVGQSVAA